MHHSAHGSTLGGFRAEAMSSVPSSCALCAQPLGHCLCVPPRGGSAAQAAGLGEPSGAPTTLELEARRPHRPHTDAACVPLSARRCERARRERSRRRRLDGRPAGARRRRHLRPPRPLHRLPRPPDLRPERRRHDADAPAPSRPAGPAEHCGRCSAYTLPQACALGRGGVWCAWNAQECGGCSRGCREIARRRVRLRAVQAAAATGGGRDIPTVWTP